MLNFQDRFPVELSLRRGAQWVLPMRVGGATSQLDIRSLTPLFIAGCGRLQLGVPPLGYFGRLVQVVDN